MKTSDQANLRHLRHLRSIGRSAAIRRRRLKRAEFFLDELAQFPEVYGAGLQGAIFGRSGFPLGHGRGAGVGIQGPKHHQAARGIRAIAVPRVVGADADRDRHAGATGVDQPRADPDDIADGDGFVERDAADGDGDAGESAPAGRARSRAFVHCARERELRNLQKRAAKLGMTLSSAPAAVPSASVS